MKKRTYVAVDENNHWLAYGEFDGPEAARDEARKATDFESGLAIFVYEVAAEFTFDPEK